MLNFLASIFIAKQKVQESRFLNKLEIFNELAIQAVTVHMAIFTTCKIEEQTLFAWSFISIVILTIAVNLIFIFKSLSKFIILFYVCVAKNRKNLFLKLKSMFKENKSI